MPQLQVNLHLIRKLKVTTPALNKFHMNLIKFVLCAATAVVASRLDNENQNKSENALTNVSAIVDASGPAVLSGNQNTPAMRYSGVFDAVLSTISPSFDPKNATPVEQELYVSAFLDWVKFDDLERVPRYLKNLNGNECDSQGNTALHFCKSLAVLNVLLDHGADVFAKNEDNVLPISVSRSPEIHNKLFEVMADRI